MKLAPICIALVLSICTTGEVVAEIGDICPPKAAPGGFDFYLPCTPMPNIHWGLADQIYFGSKSTELTVAAREILDKQAAYLLANPDLKIDLVGLADSREAPTPIERMELGGNRAATARAYLIGRGIDATRINAEGSGNIALVAKHLNEPTLALMRFVYAKQQE